MADVVHLELADGRATITLDSQRNRNALSRQLLAELDACLEHASGARVIVLRHEGPAFCAGADLKERADTSTQLDSRPMVAVMERLMDADCPTIAAVDGAVRAGGIGLMASCDLVVVARPVTFALTEVRIGVAAAMLTGEPFGADHALEIGLVTHVADDVSATVDRLCEGVIAGSPRAVAATKRILRDVPDMDRTAAFEEMRALSDELFRSDDAVEGMAAFAEKRAPRWVR